MKDKQYDFTKFEKLSKNIKEVLSASRVDEVQNFDIKEARIDSKISKKLKEKGFDKLSVGYADNAKKVSKKFNVDLNDDSEVRAKELILNTKTTRSESKIPWMISFATIGLSVVLLISYAVFFTDMFNKPKSLGLLSELVNTQSTPLITLRPDTLTNNGYAAQKNSFKMNLKEPITSDIKTAIAVEPKIDFTVETSSQGDEVVYTIVPSEELEKGQEYKISLQEGTKFEDGSELRKDLTWVISVEPQFNILSTLPANESLDVPSDSSIEIEFNHREFDVTTIDQYIDIFPKVSGHFEKYGSRAIFVADHRFEKETKYTVTIDDQYTNIAGEKLKEGKIFSFTTSQSLGTPSNDIAYMYFHSGSNTFSNSLPISTAYNVINRMITISDSVGAQIQFDLYKLEYQDAKSYLLKNKGMVSDVPENAKLIDTKTYQLQQNSEDYNYRYEATENGFYIIKATSSTNGNTAVDGVMRTQLSLVALDDEQELQGWVMDLASETGVSGADIKGYNADQSEVASAKSSEGGYFQIGKTDLYFAEYNGSFAMLDTDFLQNKVEYGTMDTHMSYTYKYMSPYVATIFTDKPSYFPGDVVNYKSIIRKSVGEDLIIPKDKTATVKITSFSFNDNKYSILQTQQIPVNSAGEIIGSYTIPVSLTLHDLSISITVDGERVQSAYIYIGEYVKPTYKVSVTAEKDKAFAGESVQLLVEATDYSNRPMSNAEVLLNVAAEDLESGYRDNTDIYGSVEKIVSQTPVKLDKNGRAYYTYTPQINYGDYNFYTFTFFVTIPEHNDIVSTNDLILVSANRVGLKNSKNYVSIPTGDDYTIDMQSINLWGSSPAPNQEFSVYVTRDWTEKIYTGSHYDSYYKKTVEDYDSISHTDTFLEKTNYITNGDGRYDLVLQDLKEGSYKYIVEWGEHKYQGTLYVFDFEAYDSSDRFIMKVTASQESAVPGENLVATVHTKGSYNLIMAVSGRALDSWTQFRSDNGISSTNIDFVMPDKSYPKATVCVFGIFNSKEYFLNANNGQSPSLEEYGDDQTKLVGWDCVSIQNTSEEGLARINTSADKDKYKPGDQVNLDITVSNSQGGNSKSSLLVVLIDQSLLDRTHTKDYKENYLREVLYDRTTGDFYISSARMYDTFIAGVGGGGAGGSLATSSVREDFKDVAAWLATVETDNNGKASVDIDLPDNLTTWNILVVSSDEKGNFGIANSSIYTTLPASVDFDIPDIVRINDRFAIEGQVTNFNENFNGKAVYKCKGCTENEATAEFTIDQNDIQEIRTSFAVAQDAKIVEIESTIYKCNEGNCDEFIDGVRKKIPVLDSGFVTNDNLSTSFNSQQTSLEHNINLKNDFRQDVTSGTVTISKTFPMIFSPCLYLSNTMSTDSLSAQLQKNVFMAQNYDAIQPENVYKDDLDNIISKGMANLVGNQNNDGGYGYFTYDSSSLEPTLSAVRALSIASRYIHSDAFNYMSQQNARDYLEKIILSEEYNLEHKIFALNGLVYLDKQSAQAYIGTIVQEFEKREEYMTNPSLIVALMDTYNELDSTGNVNELAAYLSNVAISDNSQMHWESPESLIISMRDPKVMTAYAYNAISSLELWDVKAKTKNWLLDSINNQLSCNYTSMLTEYALANSDLTNIFDRSYDATFDIMLNGEFISKVELTGDNYWSYQNVFIDGSKFKSGDNIITINRNGEGDVYVISNITKEVEDNVIKSTGDDAITITKKLYDNSTGAELPLNQPIPENTVVKVEIIVETTKDINRVVLHDAIPGGFKTLYDIYALRRQAQQFFTSTESSENVIYNEYGYDGKDYFSFNQYQLKPGKQYIFSYIAVADLQGKYDGGKSSLYMDNESNLLKTITNGTIVIE